MSEQMDETGGVRGGGGGSGGGRAIESESESAIESASKSRNEIVSASGGGFGDGSSGGRLIRNCYDGVAEPWQVRIVAARARRYGWRGADLDSAVEQVVLALVALRHDSERPDATSPESLVALAADRRLKSIRRGELRARLRVERWWRDSPQGAARHSDARPSELDRLQLAWDVREVVARLRPELRELCELLAQDLSITDVARRLGVSWARARTMVEEVRDEFRRCGVEAAG